VDLGKQLLQQVEPAVNITDNIGAIALSPDRLRLWR
jgi:hypothetical protein